jgi:hypothetical protein
VIDQHCQRIRRLNCHGELPSFLSPDEEMIKRDVLGEKRASLVILSS